MALICSFVGYTTDKDKDFSKSLFYVTLPIVDNSICAIAFPKATIRATNICLKSELKKSTCNG